MLKNKWSLNCWFVTLMSAMLSHHLFALPKDGTNTLIAGDADYSIDQSVNTNGGVTATLSASQNSVIEFNGNPGKVFNVEVNDVLNVISSATNSSSAISILVDINDIKPSRVNGVINGDNQVSLYLRNQAGFIFGKNGSIINLPSFVATSHDFSSSDFLSFANGNTDAMSLASGDGKIIVRGLEFKGDQLVLISDVVDIDGKVVVSGEFTIAVGETVELGLASSNKLTVDITQALQSGSLSVSKTSDVSAALVDWQLAVNDPAALAVNINGAVRASGVSTGPNGEINLVAKGGQAFLLGELDATGGDVTVAADKLYTGANVTADNLIIRLGESTAYADAVDGRVLGLADLVTDASVSIYGAVDGQHSLIGLVDPRIKNTNQASSDVVNPNDITNYGVASLKLAGQKDSVQFYNINSLKLDESLDQTVVVEKGASINEIVSGRGQDFFTIQGTVNTIKTANGDDRIVIDGGTVTGLIDAGNGSADSLENVYLFDERGEPTNTYSNQTSSLLVNAWQNVNRVIPANWPNIENQYAEPISFNNLNTNQSSGLFLVGQSMVNAPCRAASNADAFEIVATNNLTYDAAANADTAIAGVKSAGAETVDGTAAVPAIIPSLDEDCFKTPEYLALRNTSIYFDTNSHEISNEAALTLDKVTDYVLMSGLFNHIQVSGHTDSVGSNVYNLHLSKQRAESTIAYMTEQGVKSDVFESFYYGEIAPSEPNDSAANRAKNRRVVIELKK